VTVCIAARCQGGYIICAADRMLTAGDIQFQPPTSKIFPITTAIAMMTAGDASIQGEILQRVIADVFARAASDPDNWWRVADVSNLYYDHYKEIRSKHAENEVLAPLGLTYKTYYEKQKGMDSQLVRQIATELLNYELRSQVQAICCGIDPSGSHIYMIDERGTSCEDYVGFAAIGIGMNHAESQLMFAQHSELSSPEETTLLVYAAKKRAEVAPGVGEATDMVVLGPQVGQTTFLDETILRELESIYNEEQEKMEQARRQSKLRINQYVQEFGKTAAAEGQTTEEEVSGGDPSAD
jgi:20S proteasome alpha/beta subunit